MSTELVPQDANLPVKEEAQQPDKLDKFRDHLLHRRALKPSEHATLEKYRKVFAWRSRMFSPQQVVSMLMQEYSLRYSQAYQLVGEATRLYGKVEEIDKAGLRAVLIENLHVAMGIALRENNSRDIIAAVKEIKELGRLAEDNAELSPEDLMPARVARYTQNNTVINNNFGGTTPPPEVQEGEVIDE